MKKGLLVLATLAPVLVACSGAPTLQSNAKTVYINENVGFAVKGYSYEQDGLVCDIDNYLVDTLVDKAAAKNIKLVRVKSSVEKSPLLAIDIDSLALGQKKTGYIGNNAVDPKLGVMAGLLIKGGVPDVTEISQRCVAFANQTGQIGFSNVGGSSSNCYSLKLCARRVSGDIIDWVAPQL